MMLGSAGSLFPAEQWLKIATPNFELFTTADARKGREAVLYFEHVRELFEKISRTRPGPKTLVRIIAFQSEKEYGPYRATQSAAAYYVGGAGRDYIVMKDISADNYPVALHEYFHLVVNHSGLALPIWLNEGLADIYSTLKPAGRKLQIGDIMPGRLQQMQNSKWMDLNALLAVDPGSPYYNEREKTGIFYSESWALAHMLYFSNEYWKQFGEFLAQIRPGNSQAATFQRVYGKSLQQVTDDLDQYLRGTRFNGATLNVKLEKLAEEPDVRPAASLESGLALAELLTLTRKNSEAKAAYENLARENPSEPEVELAWGRLAGMNFDRAEMRRHYARAIELGVNDGQVYYDYAMALREGGGKEAEIAAALRKAVELKPDFPDAHYALGMYDMDLKQYSEAVVNLGQVKKLTPDRAPSYFRALAFAYYELHKPEEAKKNAESALKYSSESKDVDQAKQLLAYVTQAPSLKEQDGSRRLIARDAPPALKQTTVVEGVLQQVDCLGKGARLRILTGVKQVSFLIEDPASVRFKSASPEASHSLTCGPQNPVNVTIEHLPKPDPEYGTEGLVRSIEFR
jgi:tetratricopeptide (TPR) repeat protein